MYKLQNQGEKPDIRRAINKMINKTKNVHFLNNNSGRNQWMSRSPLHVVITLKKDKSGTNIFNWSWLNMISHT